MTSASSVGRNPRSSDAVVAARQPHAAARDDVLLEARAIVKEYGSTKALQGADLVLRAGRIHALMGENGAGKSTLVQILVGAAAPTSGAIALQGRPVSFDGVSEAIAAGIVPIYQQSSLFPNLTVLENLFVFETAASHGVSGHQNAQWRRLARQMLNRIGLNVSLDQAVASLSLGEKQLLEIARGLGRDCKLLVLDEPTAALSQADTNRLFAALRQLASAGVGILYISHKTDEIARIADEITVLRDGVCVISGAPLKSTSMQAIVSAMVGHTFSVGEKNLPVVGTPVLTLVGAARRADDPEVSITVHASEILGIAGLAGSGAEEIGAMLAGALACTHGALSVNGRPVGRMGDRATAVTAGIGYVPADRIVDGLFPGHDALRNASASILDHLTKFGLLSRHAESIRLSAALTDVLLMPNQPRRLIDEFSGGNQQKVLLARNLAVVDIKALVLVEPTRGVDVGARDIIHDRILKAAAEGLAIALVSTDLEELTSLSHRIAIVRDRRLTMELPRLSSPAVVASAMLGESQ